MLVETFLQGKNQDCLEQVLSFLTCNELANAGKTSKSLHQCIFEANEEEGNINLIWQGAEHALTNHWHERQFSRHEPGRTGSNAREHCRLFATASKAAKAFEMSDEIAEDRVMVDGVFSNLVNVREYDAASVAEQKAIGAKETRTIEEVVSESIRQKELTEVKIDEEYKKARREEELRRKEEIEKLRKLTPPDEPNNHGVFVRITRVASGELILQGFCVTGQKYPWWLGLGNMARELVPFGPRQGLQIFLDHKLLKQSEEMQYFQEYYSSGQQGHPEAIGLNVTAVAIDKRNYSVQCLFQQDQTKEIRYSGLHHGLGLVHGLKNYQFPLESKWGRDSIQLGSSMEYDRYYLSYTFSLNVAPSETGGCLMVPSLDVDIQHDTTVSDQAMMGAMNRFVASRYNIDTGAE
mmetsp:Transcript_46430/g.112549  ORF Transcript_46430/g.112549 Transcript_46430/m.112549 type:complete len:407 (-) Transcript_46430:31-1251(-)